MGDISIKVCEHTCNPEGGTPQSRLEILQAYVAGNDQYSVRGVRCLGACTLGHAVSVQTSDSYALFVDETHGLDDMFTKHPDEITDIIDNLVSYLKNDPRKRTA